MSQQVCKSVLDSQLCWKYDGEMGNRSQVGKDPYAIFYTTVLIS